ncbi:MAG: PQQ-binding-like beta-propeller repeat protein [Candidatus Aenigmarchaeota archaeon]|nr:PQQ-binding-like beta-propeller repeat protein [Candidatus Aenigmarchaeota archaeon]
MPYISPEDISLSGIMQSGDFISNLMMIEIRETAKLHEVPAFHFEAGGGSIGSSAAIHKGIIYFGAQDNTLYALTKDGQLLWKFHTNGGVVSSPKILNEKIVFGCYDHSVYALNLDGKLLWKFDTEGKIISNPLIAEDTIFLGSEDQRLYAISQEGRKLWDFATEGKIASNASFSDGLIFFGSFDGNLYALTTEGRLEWKLLAKGPVFSTQSAKGKVYASSADHNLYAASINGTLAWLFPTKDIIGFRNPVYADGKIYAGSDDRNMYCIDFSGSLGWRFAAQERVVAPPLVHEGVAYFGDVGNNFFAVKEGRLLWKAETQGPNVVLPAILGDRLFFGSWDCNFYCFNLRGEKLWQFSTSTGTPTKILPPGEPVIQYSRPRLGSWKTEDLDLYRPTRQQGIDFEKSLYGSFKTQYVESSKEYVRKRKGY